MPIVTARAEPSRASQEASTRPRVSLQALTQPQAPNYKDLVQQSENPSDSNESSQSANNAETPASPAPKKEVTLSPQLTALARKEAKIRQQEQALKAEREKFAAEQAEIARLKDLKTKLDAKDYTALDELGVKYEDWTNHLLNKEQNDKPEVRAINELKTEIESLKTQQKQQVDKQYEATVGQYRNEIKKLVSASPEFTTVKELKAEEHVLQHILDTFEQDGEILTVEQASKEIEDFLVEDALAMTKLSKVKAKLTPPTPPKKTLPPPKPATTITKTTAPVISEPKYAGKQMQHLSPKERLALAIQKAQAEQN